MMRRDLACRVLHGYVLGTTEIDDFFAVKMSIRFLTNVLISAILILQSFMNGTKVARLVIMREKKGALTYRSRFMYRVMNVWNE